MDEDNFQRCRLEKFCQRSTVFRQRMRSSVLRYGLGYLKLWRQLTDGTKNTTSPHRGNSVTTSEVPIRDRDRHGIRLG